MLLALSNAKMKQQHGVGSHTHKLTVTYVPDHLLICMYSKEPFIFPLYCLIKMAIHVTICTFSFRATETMLNDGLPYYPFHFYAIGQALALQS